ncbi:TonB-dependent receptor [Flavobacteriaceae bacterium]|nr:TonB-dependent receptor [Flavobacteriaceae bacterium]
MKKVILLILVFSSYTILGQEKENYSFIFSNINLKDAILKIEEETNFKFYFANQWVNDEIKISQSFENKPINLILDSILKETDLNYFLKKDNQIILTENTVIYNELSSGFFNENEKKNRSKKQNSAPFLSIRKAQQKEIEIVRVTIGKTIIGEEKDSYILKGIIRNSRTGAPLENINILVKNKNLGAVTNQEGFYTLELPAGINLIETQALGIESIKRELVLYNNGILNLNLEEVTEDLDEVILSVSALKNVQNASTGTNFLESENTKNIPLVMGERDILKVATTLPGISSAGEGASGFNVRGGKSDQNLILLDNTVLYNPAHFFGIFPALNPFAIEDISIYKGAIPARYGGRLSAVFDIKSKIPSKDKIKGEASLGPVTANAVLEIPIKKNKSGVLIGGRGAYSDWVLKSLNDEKLNSSTANFYDLIVGYHHDISKKNKLSAVAYLSKDEFSITSDSLYGYNNRLINLKWEHQFNNENSVRLKLSNSSYKFGIDYDGSTTSNFRQQYKIDEKHLKLAFTSVINSKNTFNYGISSKYYTVAPGEKKPLKSSDLTLPFKLNNEYALESGVFFSDSYKFNEKLLIDAGIRFSFFNSLGPKTEFDYAEDQPKSVYSVVGTNDFGRNEVTQTYGGPEFRFSGRYLITDTFSVKLGYHSLYQYLHILTNATTASPIDTWKLSDRNIKPQQSSQFSLGVYKNFNDNMYELSLEGFHKNQENLLDFKTGASLLLNEQIETEVLQGKGMSYGAELLIRKNKGKLSGWLGYTYSRSFQKFESQFREEQINGGEFFPSNFDKPHDFSLVMNYKFTQRLSLSSNVIYQTGRPVTFPVGNYSFNQSEFVLYSDRNQFRIPDYFRIDLGFNIEGSHKLKKLAHSFWSISVYNILGRNNPYSVFFVSQNGEVKGLQSTIFGVAVPSISYNLKF